MWVNGKKKVEALEYSRALQFGDGCFTTIAVIAGKALMLKAHLKRLRENCERLLMNDPDFIKLENEINSIAVKQKKAVLKVILITSDGMNGRGYSRGCNHASTRIILLLPWPTHYIKLQKTGVRLFTSPIRLARNPFFAGMKHLNRLEQVLIRQHIDYKGGDEALVLDTKGIVIECCTANLFWRKQNDIYTPCLNESGVEGIMRNYFITQLVASGQVCNIANYSREDVLQADEVTICNALMPVLPVYAIDNVYFNTGLLYKQFYETCCKYYNLHCNDHD
ncbi:aminodeoxychorismate lyase [Candidatus Pantoea carbekii]|uniref:aminodeoxychorismate lyase n=1 Tax=Candidatus Pantoea carbekii TaxID=1235990 RepID=UPI0006187936|nr:aminodeoxychorismate lyase [Candidatus Pantoea carbekii]AKC32130.1 aminodeoxychorismate Lyase PabC [Candidatus Pantoea carbekii]